MVMDVSIIIPCLNEERNISDCLRSLVSQDYQLGNYEIIVVDNGSKDQTQNIVEDFRRNHGNITLIVESRKGVAIGRNTGIRHAKYDYIALTDADCEAPADWLTILVENFCSITKEDNKIVAVGGNNNPPENSSNFLKAIGIALDSYAGSFNSVQGRRFAYYKYVTSLSNLNVLYRKDKLFEVGLYDESLLSEAEDADLNYRLSLSGNRFVFIPQSFVWHKMRPTPKTWFKNMFRYGKGRARLLKRHPSMWETSFILPILFVLMMLSMALSILNKFFLLPMFYFVAIIVFSFLMCFKKRNLSVVFHVVTVYIVQHFGYAFGEIYGLLKSESKMMNKESTQVAEIWDRRWKGSCEKEPLTFLGRMMFNAKKKAIKKALNDIQVKTVIEVGCGLGHTLQVYRNEEYDCCGIDISPEAVSVCKNKGLNATIRDVAGVDEEYDLVSSDGMLEHFLNFESYAKHLMRISRRYVLLIQPNHDSFTGKTLVYLSELFMGGKNVYEYNYRIVNFINIFTLQGFKIVRNEKIFFDVFRLLLFEKLSSTS